jgi:manganese efflux pump family protein
MGFGLLALFSWLATAAFGTLLVCLWAQRAASSAARRLRYGLPPPYIPVWLVVTHVLLAVGGLVAWVGALLYFDELAYAALPLLALVALAGASMFVRWLGSRRARRVAQPLTRAPSVSRLPTVAVVGHGLLGVTTVLLVLLSYFRPQPF